MRLRGIEQWITNEAIVERLRKVGFLEVEVKGAAKLAKPELDRPSPTLRPQFDEHLVNVLELPDE